VFDALKGEGGVLTGGTSLAGVEDFDLDVFDADCGGNDTISYEVESIG